MAAGLGDAGEGGRQAMSGRRLGFVRSRIHYIYAG